DRPRFQRLLRSKGMNDGTTIVFYGDKNNWWATYAFWVFQLFGVKNLRLMDGGRLRWAEEGRELVTAAPRYPEGDITVQERDDVLVYCRIGERSSHTWFALTYLLGFEHVRNYDGSWTEWGNLVKAPVEKP